MAINYQLMEKKAQEIINAIIKGMETESKFKKKILRVRYREDYQDYRIVLDDNTHCEMREKLIHDIIAFQAGGTASKELVLAARDTKNEIQFRLLHAIPLEEWEEDPTETKPKSKDDQIAE